MSGGINILGDITIFISPDYSIRNVNKSIFNFLQYTEEQLIGKPVGQILPDYNLDLLRSQDYLPFKDTEIINQNGDRIPMAVSASAIRDDQQQLIGIWMLLNHTDSYKEDKVTLRDLEQRYRAMTDHALDAVIVMNSMGMVTEWNKRAEIEFGWLEEEAVGQNLGDLIIPVEYREHHKKGLARFVHTGEGRILNKRMELSALHRYGHAFPIELTVTPIRWGKSFIFNAFVRNITERKTNEQELILAKEIAEAGTKAKSEFLATISHEIRTPLNGIIGMTHLLKDTELNPEQEEYVDYLIKSEDALISVINDVLDYSKIESGNVELNVEPFELKACILETFDLLSTMNQEKQLKMSYSIDSDIPSVLVGDLGRLRQVMINLVGNAVKFTEQGGIHIEARLLEQERDEFTTIKISVQDTGIGIPKELAVKLFEPFSQLDSSNTRKYGGTGLGLAISKKLVQLMGGDIWLEESDRRGACFSFTVALKGDSSGDQIEKSRSGENNKKAQTAEVRLLIAEDNIVNQKVLLKMLNNLGFTADIANTGVEVLECVQRKDYDLVLMDIQMPEMDGIEATKRIRQLIPPYKRPKVIAVTANAFQSDKEKYLTAGLDDYISKPVRLEQLKSVLSRLIKY
ncbi:ATP-binding protein [Paenibacillus sp. BR2-3]|uniref:PAS domain-containing hybrid sensor histidine kinase/response regulator n=1 Tax=Paenibacillus sp. BR2-3 TaxID=3048494 RepID=UPI00397798FD